ncbi:MAG: hypothetical protein GY782_03490 [Gammaproteobacteria bacterium]|nr:hypothetical protein [Gammaproteobacteria bacterium]
MNNKETHLEKTAESATYLLNSLECAHNTKAPKYNNLRNHQNVKDVRKEVQKYWKSLQKVASTDYNNLPMQLTPPNTICSGL